VATLSSQGHFFSFAVYLFRRGVNERPTTLDRQRRTPTKGRIQNTPENHETAFRGRRLKSLLSLNSVEIGWASDEGRHRPTVRRSRIGVLTNQRTREKLRESDAIASAPTARKITELGVCLTFLFGIARRGSEFPGRGSS